MKVRFLWIAAAACTASPAFADSPAAKASLDGVEVKGLIVRVPVSADGQVNYDAAEYRVDAGSRIASGVDLVRAFSESPDASAMGSVNREALPVPQAAGKNAGTEQYPYYYGYGYYPYSYSYNYGYPYYNYPGYVYSFNAGYNYYYNSPGLRYYNNYSNPYYYRYYYFGRR